MNAPKQKSRPTQDVSWPMLLTIGAVVTGSLWLLSDNVLYTEGEVTQGLFTLLVSLVAACVLLGFRITYFMNNPGITYWYSSKTGFDYYPD